MLEARQQRRAKGGFSHRGEILLTDWPQALMWLISGPHPHPPTIQGDRATKTKRSPKFVNLMQLLLVNQNTISHTINSVDIHMKLFAKPNQSEQNPETFETLLWLFVEYRSRSDWSFRPEITIIMQLLFFQLSRSCMRHNYTSLVYALESEY